MCRLSPRTASSLCLFSLLTRPPPPSTLFPYTTLFRSRQKQPYGRQHTYHHYRTQRPAYEKTESLRMQRSEERFSRNAETDLVCRLLLEKKKPAVRRRRMHM